MAGGFSSIQSYIVAGIVDVVASHRKVRVEDHSLRVANLGRSWSCSWRTDCSAGDSSRRRWLLDLSNWLGTCAELLEEIFAAVDVGEVAEYNSQVHLAVFRSVGEHHGRVWPLVLACPERTQECGACRDERLRGEQGVPASVGIVEVGLCRLIFQERHDIHSIDHLHSGRFVRGIGVGLADVLVKEDFWHCLAVGRH